MPVHTTWQSNILLVNFKAQGQLQILTNSKSFEKISTNIKFWNYPLTYNLQRFLRISKTRLLKVKSDFCLWKEFQIHICQHFFLQDFSSRKPCPFKKVISIKSVFLHSLIDCGFDFTVRWNRTRLIWDLRKQLHSSQDAKKQKLSMCASNPVLAEKIFFLANKKKKKKILVCAADKESFDGQMQLLVRENLHKWVWTLAAARCKTENDQFWFPPSSTHKVFFIVHP